MLDQAAHDVVPAVDLGQAKIELSAPSGATKARAVSTDSVLTADTRFQAHGIELVMA